MLHWKHIRSLANTTYNYSILPHAAGKSPRNHRLVSLFLVTILMVSSVWCVAQDEQPVAADKRVELKDNHPEKYTVHPGDTLWDISAKFLKDPWLWPSVWYANPKIANPHLIYPGDVISLVYINGKPQLRIDRGRPLVKMTPQGRVIPLNRPIPSIPVNAVAPFLNHNRIITRKEYKEAPYVVHAMGEHLITGAGDRVYVRGHKDKDKNNVHYVVVREGQEYRDPKTKEILGYEAKYVGDSRVEKFGKPSTHYLVTTNREVLIGDRVLPADDDRFKDNFVPHAPKAKTTGRIIAVMEGVTQIGQHQVVVINKGKREGMEVGHVLAVYQKGDLIVDPIKKDKLTLPDVRAGILMVFRTFDKVSYAIVMRARRNMNVMDEVRNP